MMFMDPQFERLHLSGVRIVSLPQITLLMGSDEKAIIFWFI